MAEVPHASSELSLVLVLPGRQREFLAGGLAKLEGRYIFIKNRRKFLKWANFILTHRIISFPG